jgi:hypothetical protein
MGYCYGKTTSGHIALCCDVCGTTGGVRKRLCPHFVLTDNSRTSTRQRIRHCSPNALCPACYDTYKATLHDQCKADAAAAQRGYDENQSRLDRGEKMLLSARGSWDRSVPKGFVGATFGGPPSSDSIHVLIPLSDYDRTETRSRWLSEFPATRPWILHPQATTDALPSDALPAAKEREAS